MCNIIYADGTRLSADFVSCENIKESGCDINGSTMYCHADWASNGAPSGKPVTVETITPLRELPKTGMDVNLFGWGMFILGIVIVISGMIMAKKRNV